MTGNDQCTLLTNSKGIIPFEQSLAKSALLPLYAENVDILQINITHRCNLQCKHCHVQAGPDRTEVMPKSIMEACLNVVRNNPIDVIDITGGAPELHPDLSWFLTELSKLSRRLIVRSNLAVLHQPEYQHFLDLYSQYKVEIVGSLPHFRSDRTDRQRGNGIFEQVITIIRELNNRGYGKPESGFLLDIVHNPVGAYLPGNQVSIEQEYRNALAHHYGIQFNQLYCLTNNPVGRYLEYLLRSDNYNDYMAALADAYNPVAAKNVMCRSTVSVGWDGTLYDCDFNQMLGLPLDHSMPRHIEQFDSTKLSSREIVTNNHCYACTAGSGSSCQGATDA